jgi:histidinol phosphatase-like PHP family hydrolase
MRTPQLPEILRAHMHMHTHASTHAYTCGRQMQLELLQNGPGVVAFTVYSDFQSYSSGERERENERE